MAHPSQRSRRARFANSPMQAFGTWKPKGRCASASYAPPCGRTTSRTRRHSVAASLHEAHRCVSGTHAPRVSQETRLQLFFNYLGVLDHCDAAALCQFAFQSDIFAAQIGKLIINRLMFAHDEIRFALADDTDGTAASDAFGAAGLPVFLAHGVMVDKAHHID